MEFRDISKRTHYFIRSHKKLVAIIGAVLLILITALLIQQVFAHQDKAPKQNKVMDSPGYQTVLPDGKSIKDLGGWERISPPNSEPVYAYTDKIGEVPVTISEQPLPKTLEGNAESQVAALAKSFNATTKIIAGDTTVYLGTSVKGPQSAIFIKVNLLILIKSQQTISDKAWITYIKSLNV